MNTRSTFRTGPKRAFSWLLPALLLWAGPGAQAATPPTLIITGTIGSGTQNVDGYTGSVAFDTSSWWDKPYTLELRPDAAGVPRVTEPFDDIPGASSNIWGPVNMGYRLSIDGSLVFVGNDNRFSEVLTENDVLIPPGIPDLPAGVTYDYLYLRFSGLNLGCFSSGSNGFCGDDADDIYEYGTVRFEYSWDTAVRQGLTGDAYPDLRSVVFADGVGSASFTVGHFAFTPTTSDGTERAMLPFSVTGVSVTPVPEPATWGMLLAGLGLVGGAAARRRR